MAVAANKRSVMTLYSSKNDLKSHQVRLVLAEKGVGVEISFVSGDDRPEDLMQLNPYPDATPLSWTVSLFFIMLTLLWNISMSVFRIHH